MMASFGDFKKVAIFPLQLYLAQCVLVTFHGGSFLVDFLKKEIVGFDEKLAVVL